MSLLGRYKPTLTVSVEEHDEVTEVESTVTDNVDTEIEVPQVQHVSVEQEAEANAVISEPTEGEGELVADAVAMEQYVREAEEEIATLESYKEILEYGIANNDYSKQFAAVLAKSMERYSELGEEWVSPALEDFSHDNLDLYYEVALEDVAEKLWEINKASMDPARGISKLVGWLSKRSKEKKAVAFTAKADAMLDRLTAIGGVDADVSMVGLERRIGVGGQLPKNVATALRQDRVTVQRSFEYVTKVLVPAMVEGSKVTHDVVKLIRDNSKEAAEQTIAKYATKEYPFDGLPRELIDGDGVIGNRRLNIGPKSTDNDPIGKLKDHVKRGKPKMEKVGDVKGDVTVNMSSSDVRALLVAVKEYTVVMDKATKDLISVMRGTKIDAHMDYKRVRNEGDILPKVFNRSKSLAALRNYSLALVHRNNTVIDILFEHTESSIKTALTFAERAVKALEKADK